MISLAELKKRLDNIIQIGSVHEAKIENGHHLVKVILDDDGDNKRVSPFLPVKSLANTFGRAFFPVRSGEQVIVISPFGNINGGFIIRSIFHNGCKVPDGANKHTAIVEFEDGTKVSYDSNASDLKVDAVKSINVLCETAYIDASQSIYMKAPVTTIESDVTVKGSLLVEELFTAQGGMKVFAKAGQAIGAELSCELVSTKDITALNLKATQDVHDSQGNLSNHTNEGYSRD